ncbi:M24 family metallopeptidase [Leifsonia sp. McL0607]|uniref:M24 family metallopeptidase n=1 Tax=Leifsonia sp. McL0607 TaxID=3415672 RepID=UPI003CF15E8F
MQQETKRRGAATDEATARAAELEVKLQRIRRLLDRRGAPAVALSSRESLAWLFGGARVTVPTNGDPVLSAVVSADDLTLHVYSNERERLLDEELPTPQTATVVDHPWFAPLPGTAGQLPSGGVLREADAVHDLRALRAPLLPIEAARYRALGEEVAAAVTRVATGARPEQTERAVAAALSRELVGLGAEPIVLLVAGRSRLGLRHPLPTEEPVGGRAMLVVGARRHGLIVNLTRWIGSEPHSEGADARLFEVEADAFEATRPGRTLAEILGDIATSYREHGFAADEWIRHHQGGPTGYAGRDPRATPVAADVAVAWQAFAWNPSAPRVKVEDTVLIGDRRPDVLTVDPSWPSRAVRGIERPLALPFA